MLFVCLFIGFVAKSQVQKHNKALNFTQIPTRWDEALPLGNGFIGALIWQKNDKLRMSLDQVYLWDLRPMAELHTTGFDYKWVKKQVENDNYAAVQKIGDIPYEREPAPSKLPGAAIEFDIKNWGKVVSTTLNIENATAKVVWENGVEFTSFVEAYGPYGFFKFENCTDNILLDFLPPIYESSQKEEQKGNSVSGDNLARLGYKQGEVFQGNNTYLYNQKGWGGFEYTVVVKWKRTNFNTIEGAWTILTDYRLNKKSPEKKYGGILSSFSYSKAFKKHSKWWANFWSKSSISIPDSTLEKQYYLEQYKFGSVARATTPPISLQAAWTADNGRLPPWKGDFHHDLNTQLSYWPAYAGNHLEEAMGYINHLEKNKNTYKKYTKWYFGTEGIAVPGVTDLDGVEMGGWIQYSLSPTVSSWLAQHYYMQWRYSMDKAFLRKKAYPWFKEVAQHLEQITYLDKAGNRQLPLSSSPEINDNNKSAWFLENTNYDLALMRYVFEKASELANELNFKSDAEHFEKIHSEFSEYHLSENNELKFAKELPYNQSHRHFSHLMAIHPLGEIRWENGAKDQGIIKNSLKLLDKIGPGNWCGYSYAWEGNLKARAKDGEGARSALYDFATAFCSINSFHLNGDQTKSGKSSFTYRPFTLEGNFAFAAGIQEMLIQSYAGFMEVFPAVPESWTDLSFNNLRTEGAFLVSAKKEGGQVSEIEIKSEKGGVAKVKLPFKTLFFENKKGVKILSQNIEFVELMFEKEGSIKIKNGYE